MIGAGTMGHGIAQVAAEAGLAVNLVDVSDDILARALSSIRGNLERRAARGEIPAADLDRVLASIRPTTDLAGAVRGADLVVEAVPESMELKRRVLSEASTRCPPGALVASNTSSLPISELAEAVEGPDRFLGLHFFNPPQAMRLVEVVRGAETSERAVRAARTLARALGKVPVTVERDVPGFLVNRILMRVLNGACAAVAAGEEPAAVDSSLRYGAGLPMGALLLADFIGLDVVRDIAAAMVSRGFEMTPCGLWSQMVEEGRLGRKSGRGFYDWSGGRPRIPRVEGPDPLVILAPAINEAAWLVREGVADAERVDLAVRLGLNWPVGPLELGDRWGPDRVIAALGEAPGPECGPDPLLEEAARGGGRLSPRSGGERLRTSYYRRDGPVAWLVIDRPLKMNALNLDAVADVAEAAERAAADPEVRVLAIRGAGEQAFSSGADVSDMADLDPGGAEEYSRRLHEAYSKLRRIPKLTVAAVNGLALGGGLELALWCDYRVAVRAARFGLPEGTLGIVPGSGGTQLLPRISGWSAAAYLMLTGARVDAETALRWGIVDEVVYADELEDRVRALAEAASRVSPSAAEAAKAAMEAGEASTLSSALGIEENVFSRIFATEDAREGLRAFLEKRRPRFGPRGG